MNKHKFHYDVITTDGTRIVGARKFKNMKEVRHYLNTFYPGCLIMDIHTDHAGDFGYDFRERF